MEKIKAIFLVAIYSVSIVFLFAASSPASANENFCISCVNVRVGRPGMVLGPVANMADSTIVEIPLGRGWFRGFTGGRTTYAITSPFTWYLPTNSAVPVLSAGPGSSFDSCGQWLDHIERLSQSEILGFIHTEDDCNYSIGQTNKSMALATSRNNGLTWSPTEQFIIGTDKPEPAKTTGEGDCDAVNGHDGYLYTYCFRNSDWRTIVARAPVSMASNPESWKKYFQGSWKEGGLRGNADSVGDFGTAVARWKDNGAFLLMQNNKWYGGINLSFSTDENHVVFSRLPTPIVPQDDVNWARPAPTDLAAYVVLQNQNAGDPDFTTNQLSGQSMLFYTYVAQGQGFDQRYVATRPVWMWQSPTPAKYQTGIELSRWQRTDGSGILRTTDAPVIGDGVSWVYVRSLGYLLTAPPASTASVKIQECYSAWPGHDDYLVTNDTGTGCAPYQRQRTLGWLLANPESGTTPLFRCWSSTGMFHFVSDHLDANGKGDCEGNTVEWLLGYALVE